VPRTQDSSDKSEGSWGGGLQHGKNKPLFQTLHFFGANSGVRQMPTHYISVSAVLPAEVSKHMLIKLLAVAKKKENIQLKIQSSK
jgi:hypothetical protein